MVGSPRLLASYALSLLALMLPASPQDASGPDRAQDGLAPAWQVDSFLEDAGLVGGSVVHFDFEPDGTGWFATSVGLLRFDGYEWERFTERDGLPSDQVRSVCVASDGRLWIGTDRGASVFDGERFDPAGTPDRLAGPSVRRIVETSDGALYFCSDSWPDAEAAAGLTRFSAGEWTRWTSRDGLPSDYVSDVFEASDGRLFVLTNRGLALFTHDGFTAPLADAGVWEGPSYVWSMVESDRHGLIVGTGGHFYQERAEGWRRLVNDAPTVYLPKLCATSDGEVLLCHRDGGTVFLAFDGERFVPVTEPVTRVGDGVELVREDPLGGVWAAGYDRLVRWNRSGPGWSRVPGAGTPLGRDAAGGLWFKSGPDRLARLGAERIELDGHGPVVFDDAGAVWFAGAVDLRRWYAGETRRFPSTEIGLTAPFPHCVDASGQLWASGARADGGSGIAYGGPDGWTTIELAHESEERIGCIRADPLGGVWCAIFGHGGREHRLLRLTEDGARSIQLPERVQLTSSPTIFVDRRGDLLLFGFFGAYRFERSDESWTRLEHELGMISGIAELEEERWFVGQGHLHGVGGVVHESPRGRTRLVVPRVGLLGSGSSYFLVSEAEVRPLVAGLDGLSAAIVVPTRDEVHAVAVDSSGALWVRAGDVTLRRTFGTHPPRPVLVAGDTRLQSGEPLALRLAARQHLRPGLDPDNAVGSWSLDDGPWSAWSDLQDPLVVENLPEGTHGVQVRVRDAAGGVSAPLRIEVMVRPVPFQDRPWFLPAVLATVLSLASLALLAFRARGELTLQKRDLEQIVERRTAEARSSERRYRALFEQARDAVLLFHLDGRRWGANHSANELLGGAEGAPDSISAIFATPEEARRFEAEAADSEDVGPDHYRIRTHSGEEREVLLSARRWHDEELDAELWQLVLRDVTELVRLEDRLRQSQKMDALGRMAGGVAHDFNNSLTVILGFADMARHGPPDLDEHLDAIVGAATRAKALVQQIQLFSRSRVGDPPVVHAGEALASVCERLSLHLGKGVALAVEIPRDLGWVRIEPQQLEQVLVNLVVNASHAMPDGGQLLIVAERIQTDGSETVLPSGEWIRIDVRDDGCGMDTRTLGRACEPFFTTKPMGRGTGLGLAIVYGVIQLAEGRVQIESAPGTGTLVRLHLPLTGPPCHPPETLPAIPADLGGAERILVVEDEEEIARLVDSSLRRAGYDVRVVNQADRALRILGSSTERVDLLLTDVVMPGLSGIALVQKARELRPDLAVIVVSGYPRPGTDDGMISELDVPFLGKPFRAEELLARVRSALDSERTSTTAS